MSGAVSCRRGEVSLGIVSLLSSHTLRSGGSARWWHWGSLLTEQGRTGEMNHENLKVQPQSWEGPSCSRSEGQGPTM